jgi:putative tricarboxylic transport membrane protein
MEENLRRALLLSRGDMATFIDRPISAGFLAFGLLLILLAVWGQLKQMMKERERRADFGEQG